MSKVATINTRIEPKLKKDAEHILHQVGLSTAEAVRLFFTHICLSKGLPFEVKLPNKETIAALEELEAGQGSKYHSMDDVWSEIGESS